MLGSLMGDGCECVLPSRVLKFFLVVAYDGFLMQRMEVRVCERFMEVVGESNLCLDR